MATSAPPALREGWDYNTPAESPAERVSRLEEIVTTLRKNRTFANAALTCMNVRYAWGGIYVDGEKIEKIGPGIWDEWVGDDALLTQFIALTNRAIILISDTYCPDPAETKLLTRYTRSCSARLGWAEQLKSSRKATDVMFAMLQYAENVLNSSDTID